MKKKTITTFAAFVAEVESNGSHDLPLFRGQAVRGQLVPKIARTDPSIDTTEKERRMLKELYRIGGAYLNLSADDDWGLLVVAQHFGMATRLLDWSSNPLAALWFAASSYQAGPCYVYMLIADTLLTSDGSTKGPFDQAKTRVFQPRLNNPRIVAQDGWFTAHRYSRKAGRFVSLEGNPDINPHMTELVIPEASRAEIVKSLDRHGINSKTLFPDLEGLCRYVSWKFNA